MNDRVKTKTERIEEISRLSQRIKELEQSEIDLNKAKETLSKTEEMFRKVFYTCPDTVGINRLDDGMFVSVNPAFTKNTGYTEEEVIGKSSIECNIWVNAEDRQRLVEGLKRDGEVQNLEAPFRTKFGEIRFLLMSASMIDLGGVPHLLCITRDITERKLAEQKLREMQSRLGAISNNLPSAMIYRVVVANDGSRRFSYLSESVRRLHGISPEEGIANPDLIYGSVHKDDVAVFIKTEEEALKTLSTFKVDVRVKDLSGGTRWSSLTSKPTLREDGSTCWDGIEVDITELKRSEESLRESEKKYSSLFDTMNEGVALHELVYDKNGKAVDYRIIDVNRSFEHQTGIKIEDAKDKLASELYGDNKPPYMDIFVHVVETGVSEQFEAYFPPMGKYFSISVFSPARNQFATVFTDITERKQTEEVLSQKTALLEAQLYSSIDGILVVDSRGKKILQNQQTVELWKIPKVIADNPNDQMQVDHVMNSTRDPDQFVGQIKYLYNHPDETSRDEIELKDGRVLDRYSAPVIGSDGQNYGRIWSFRDITERKHAEEELQNTLEILRKAVGTTIQVMVSAVETRDPYTAGHQLRSANLASAIAAEMGFPREKVEGIHIAGSIHDIGKLSIPAEILSKPTRLTDIEFSLVKEHPRKGYEILQNVESSWPLAEIVYQHHERMDGSGYPRNLKGDEILMEARILAVSDIVESMASHRPYRPALGLNAALENIENNKGTLYDADAVNACLRLFREKGYQL